MTQHHLIQPVVFNVETKLLMRGPGTWWPKKPRDSPLGQKEVFQMWGFRSFWHFLFWRLRINVMKVRPILTENTENWISRYLDVSPSWCRHFQYLGFLTGAPTKNFGTSVDFKRVLTLLHATKNSVVICRASLLYEMSYSFRSTLFVHTDF